VAYHGGLWCGVLLVVCNMVIYSVVVLLVVRELTAAITFSCVGSAIDFGAFFEKFLGGEIWMTIFLHGRKGSPSECFGKLSIRIDQNVPV
jgi:hypothetical protein